MTRSIMIDLSIDVRHLSTNKLGYLLRLSRLFRFNIEASYLAKVERELVSRGKYATEVGKIDKQLPRDNRLVHLAGLID